MVTVKCHFFYVQRAAWPRATFQVKTRPRVEVNLLILTRPLQKYDFK